MRCVMWMGLLAVAAVALALAPAVAQEDKPKLEEVDAKGKPKTLKAGQSARYVLWCDKDGWHLRVTTAGDLTAFNGVIEPVDGKITSVRLISGEGKALPGGLRPLPPIKTQSATFNVKLKISKGIIDGVDLQLDDKATAVKFALKVDDQDAPEQVFIGPKGMHPKEATFFLPARPEK
jgi:hypothetical protein